VVEFILDDAQADALIADLKREGVSLFYTRVATEFAVIDV